MPTWAPATYLSTMGRSPASSTGPDARVGDPAIDLGWSLNGAHPRFARAVWGAYETCDDRIRERALFWHRLGPWHEVIYGLDNDRPELVRSGLGGVSARLP